MLVYLSYSVRESSEKTLVLLVYLEKTISFLIFNKKIWAYYNAVPQVVS